MRRASLVTIFLTVFLDLLGFGLVVPYLPGVARAHGASDLVATLLGAVFSLMQFVFVPFWGQLSDRTGRRPVLVWSIAASVAGFLFLGNAGSLAALFAARIWNGIATANISVAGAYIADVTPREERAKGMGLIGAGVGLGFVLGPVIGGLLESYSQAHGLFPRVGALPAYAAAALAVVNLALAVFYLPESLPPEKRGQQPRRISPFETARYRTALRFPGTARAMLLSFVIAFSFAAMEQTFRLFTEDEFRMSVRSTGYVLGFVGLVLIVVQAAAIPTLAKIATDRTLVTSGLCIQAVGFIALACSPQLAPTLLLLYAAMGAIALGSGLAKPSLSAYVSKCGDDQHQGVVLGVLQSTGAFARVCGPATAGLLYQGVAHEAPYVAAALGMTVAGFLSLGLRAPASARGGTSLPTPP